MEHVTEAIGQAKAVMAAHGILWMVEVAEDIYLSVYPPVFQVVHHH